VGVDGLRTKLSLNEKILGGLFARPVNDPKEGKRTRAIDVEPAQGTSASGMPPTEFLPRRRQGIKEGCHGMRSLLAREW